VLADTWFGAVIGGITGYGVYFCFTIIVAGLILRRMRLIWLGLAPVWGALFGEIFQAFIPDARPPGACMTHAGTCGMPSGHVMTAYATLVFLFCLWLTEIQAVGLSTFLLQDIQPSMAAIFGSTVFIFTLVQVLMPFGRVLIYYHTVAQVIVGVFAGSAVGLTWFALVSALIAPSLRPFLSKVDCIYDDWNISPSFKWGRLDSEDEAG
jgi:membrane-associated phospholipid phosphatase